MHFKRPNLLTALALFCILSCPLYSQPKILEIINRVKIDSLTYFVKQLSGVEPVTVGGISQLITTRHYTKPGKDIAGQWIASKFRNYGLTTTIDNITSASGTGKNILGIKTGTRYPNKKYVICAHYDSMPASDTAPGADDDASGIAAVIEAARLFSAVNTDYTIVFAAFDEEEVDLCGSLFYADRAIATGETIMGIINLDMIAYDSDNDNYADVHTRPVANSMAIAKTMIEINTNNNVGLVLSNVNPGSNDLDSKTFWTKGFSNITLLESANDFNIHYHNMVTTDNISYFNFPYFEKCVKLAIGTLAFYTLESVNTMPTLNLISIIPANPVAGQAVKVRFRVSDPENDSAKIRIKWGDGITSDFSGYIPNSGEEEFTHIFSSAGSYIIEEEAEDEHGVEGDWIVADTLIVASSTAISDSEMHPTDLILFNNYPNPFNPTTTIKYTIPSVETKYASSLQQQVIIKVYDLLGREISTLVNDVKPVGVHSVQFNAYELQSGVYIYRIQTGEWSLSKKMVFIK